MKVLFLLLAAALGACGATPSDAVVKVDNIHGYATIAMPPSEDGRLYRITMQLKGDKGADIMFSYQKNNEDKAVWGILGKAGGKWTEVRYYASDSGSGWKLSFVRRNQQNTVNFKNIKVEILTPDDLKQNLLPATDLLSWRSVWFEEVPMTLASAEDAPSESPVLRIDSKPGKGFPATRALPGVPGGALKVSLWIKGDREKVWAATLWGGKNFHMIRVTPEWQKHEFTLFLEDTLKEQPWLLLRNQPGQKQDDFTFYISDVEISY